MKQNIPITKIPKKQLKVITELQKEGYIILDKKKEIILDTTIVMKNAFNEIYIDTDGNTI